MLWILSHKTLQDIDKNFAGSSGGTRLVHALYRRSKNEPGATTWKFCWFNSKRKTPQRLWGARRV